MKTLNHLLIAAAVAVTFNAGLSARADEALLSPRAKENQIRTAPGTSADQPNLVTNRPVGNAKAWDLAQSLPTVPSTGPSVDVAHAPRPTLSPRDPRFEAAWHENAEQKVQLAPLK